MSEPKSCFEETRARSLSKTVSWRCVAVTNSFTILLMTPTDHPLVNAIAMNITGFAVFYLFERVWNRIGWGRVQEDPGIEAAHTETRPIATTAQSMAVASDP